MKLYPCGTTVTIKNAGISGLITAVTVRFDSVCYEITYYVGGDQKVVFAREPELSVGEDAKRVGFFPNPNA